MTGTQVSVKLTGDSSSVQSEARSGAAALDAYGRSAESAGARAQRGFRATRAGVESISQQLGEMRNLVAGALGLGSIGQVAANLIRTADAMTNLQSRLRLVSSSTEQAVALQSELFRIAQQSRTEFGALGATYAQVARATESLNLGQSRLLSITQAVSQAVALSGGGEQSGQAALVQLTQGLSAGVLRGEELNSILEQTPRLARAIAEGLGVTVGELRQLGAAGELTASKILGAIEKSAPQLAAEFARMTPTVEASFTVLRNAATSAVGAIDEGSGASRVLSATLQGTASVIQSLSDGTRGLVQAFGPLAVGGAVTLGVAAMAVGVTALATALKSLAGAALLLAAPLAGPVGVLLGVAAVGLGVAAGVTAMNSRAKSLQDLQRELEHYEGTVRILQSRLDDSRSGKTLAGDPKGDERLLAQAIADRDRLRGEVARMAAGAPAAAAAFVPPFEGAKPIAEVTRGLRTRENIYREATARMAELARTYGNEIARANQGATEPTPESRRLSRELAEQFSAVARERDKQLEELNKPALQAAQARTDGLRVARERELRELEAIADERRDMEREDLADLTSLAKRGGLLEEDRIRRELDVRRAYLEDLREVESERRRLLLEGARQETDPGRREQLLAQAAQSGARLADLRRQEVSAERAAARELEELAARRTSAVIAAAAQRVDAARAGVRQMLDSVEEARLVSSGLEPQEARAQLAVQRLEAEVAALRATEGATQELITAREVELELMREQLRLAREIAIDARVSRQQEGWRRAEEQWAERQAREQEKRDDEVSRSLTDALMRGFENGKGLAENFRDTLKNMFMTLVLRPQIELMVKPAANAVSGILSRLLEGVLGGSSGGAVDAALAGGASVVDLQGRFVPALGGGGPVQPNSLYLVGDRGGELLQTGSAGGRVYPNDITRAVLGAGGRGGPATVVVKQYFDFTNSVGVGAVVQAAAQQGAAMGAAQAKAQIAEEVRRGSREYI